MPDPSADVQQQLDDAFASFRTTLEELLTAEARRSVDGVLERLSGQAGSFRLDDVTVQVTVTNLQLSHADGRGRTPRRTGTGAAKRGRPAGGVRLGVLATFAHTSSELTTADIKAHLQASGVRTSTDNLHQQLRRLVQTGDLVRTGRGRYASAAPAVAAPAAA